MMEEIKENVKEKINKINLLVLLKTLFLITTIIFSIPSITYLIKNGTIFRYNSGFKFLMTSSMDRVNQTIIYILLLAILTILYYLIVKNRNKLFKNNKQIYAYILVIALIFVLVLPFTCSDIFYYLGIGRINSKYHQNPYYQTIKGFVDETNNSKYLENDTVLTQGYENYWSDSTVVYGPIWTLICSIIAFFSFGNIDWGILLFKLINVCIHILNCYFIYKISHKKIFVLLYGLNPFILLEGIANVHNDIFMILFILISLYYIIKKKNLIISIIFLATATAIKYFPILLLPFIIIYYYRKEKVGKKIVKCIQYGGLFFIILIIPYLLYVRDFQVFSGLLIQQQKFAKNFYIIILEYFKEPPGLAKTINDILLKGFVIIYFFKCVTLLFKKNIKFREEMQVANYFLMAFTFLLITNFQPWYIMWLFPLMMWQKANNIRLIIQISLISQFANSVFLAYDEGWRNGVPFTFLMVLLVQLRAFPIRKFLSDFVNIFKSKSKVLK